MWTQSPINPARHPGIPPGSSERNLRYYAKQFKRARDYAMQMHGGQLYGERPYVFHLDAVAQLTFEYGLSPKFTIAAYIHDVLEDTSATPLELTVLFGREVSDMVYAVTGEGDSREAQRTSTVQKLKLRPGFAALKLMDRIANVEQSKKDGDSSRMRLYREEMKYYHALFSKAEPAAYQRLCKALNIEPMRVF